MTTESIIEVLGYANGNELPVRLTLRDGTEIVGIPMSVDTHLTAHEVFLHPAGDDDTEIGISIAAIAAAEMA